VLSGARKLQEASFSLSAFGVKGSIDLKGQAEGAKANKQLDAIERGVSVPLPIWPTRETMSRS
jgi:hypothetical protein